MTDEAQTMEGALIEGAKSGRRGETSTPHYAIFIGVGLLLLAICLLYTGLTFDPSVPSDSDSGVLPDRIINTGLLATKQTIFLGAATTFLSGWVMVAAGVVSHAISQLASRR